MDSLRAGIELICHELRATAHGLFATSAELQPEDPALAELYTLVNSILDQSRRTLAELSARNQQMAEVDRLKSDFLANISHELRTPLTLILAPAASLLAGRYGEISPTQQVVLERVQRNAARLDALVNDLLDFAKLDAQKMPVRRELLDAVELAASLADDAREVAVTRGLTLEFKASVASAPLIVDRSILEKILLNLLSNALKFTPPGGQVVIGVDVTENAVELSVQDTGEGIAPEHLPNLFRRFHQIDGEMSRKFEGTGLGLALAKEFAEVLGGAIDAASEPGRGACFTVRLPAPEAGSAAASATADATSRLAVRSRLKAMAEGPSPATAAADDTRPRILVIDDNADLRAYVEELLADDHVVTTVADGREALTIAEKGGFDVILSDVMIPEMDGYELTRRLKASPILRFIPVILLTARTGTGETVRGLASGADDFLSKPFDERELRGRLKAALRTRALYKELEAANQRLEAKVAERTSELAQANKTLEQANRELERAGRIKDEFLATLSHELRTPLNGILGWSEMLSAGDLDADTVASGLATIERSARVQKRLIDELLDISRIITGKLQLETAPVELPAVIASVLDSVRLSAAAKAQKLETRIAADVGPVLGDADRLRQVTWNLLTNAVKFTPAGGEILLAVERDGTETLLTVADSGQGIEADFLPHVFERFRQEDPSTKRRHGGLGLGLAIVKHLVELHGGRVEARSDGRGKGATFTVRLPLKKAQTSGQVMDVTPMGRSQRLKGIRVLVVDDARDVRELVTLILKRQGAAVTTADSVRSAVACLSVAMPDVVVSDIGMPDEDGFDLMRRLRAVETSSGRRVPAAALTAYAKQEDYDRVLQAGFLAHLPKPIEPARLVAAVAKLCGRADTGS